MAPTSLRHRRKSLQDNDRVNNGVEDQKTWRRIDATSLVALVLAGAKFKDRKLVERAPTPQSKTTRKYAA